MTGAPVYAGGHGSCTRRSFLSAGLRVSGAAAGGWLLGACSAPREGRERPSLRFLFEIGGKGTAEGLLRGPIGIARDAAGELLVTDAHNARVQRFGPDGAFRSAFDLPRDMDTSYGRSSSCGGIAVDREGLVYVAFMQAGRIGVYDAQGGEVRTIGRPGFGPGELADPGGLAIDAEGILYVADQRNRRVQRLTREGRFLGSFGGYGARPGLFDGIEPPSSRFGGPHFLALDGRGHLFTTEGALGRVQMWSLEGEPLAAWGQKGDGPGGFGDRKEPFSPNTLGPIGIAADSRGRVCVGSLNGRVQLFTATGELLAGTGTTGEAPGQFRNPHALVFDDRGDVFAVDSGNHRVQKLGAG